VGKTFIHKDKNGNIIEDLSKVKLPYELLVSIFEILNPGMTAKLPKKEGIAQ